MSGKRVVILDGCGLADQDLVPILGGLRDVLAKDGSEVETLSLREMKLAHCIGCFGCWIKTPGMCLENDDGRRVAQAVIRSDTTVFFTPVTFGGYSPDLKKMMDHFIQLISPYFQMEHGEVHHPPRYARRPRLLMIGVQRQANPHEAHIFKVLAGRTAINFHPPAYATDVVLTTDPADSVRLRLETMLARSDALPFGQAAACLMPPPRASDVSINSASPRRALLIVGSPKTNSPSTSSILGTYVLQGLGDRGWETESLTLRASLNREEGEAALLASVERAGLILLAFPLYADSLPFLVTKALAVVATHRRAATQARSSALVGNGEQRLSRNPPERRGAGHMPGVRGPKRYRVGRWPCPGRWRHRRPATSRHSEALRAAGEACGSSPGFDHRSSGTGAPGARAGDKLDGKESCSRHTFSRLALDLYAVWGHGF